MNIKIPIRRVFIIILLFFITMPTYLYTNFSFIGSLMAIVQYFLFGWMILDMIRSKFRGYSPIFWILIVTLIIESVSSYRNPLALHIESIKITVKTVGWLWLIDRELKRNAYFLIKTYAIYQATYVIINFFTLLLFPNGMYQSGAYSSCYFLGYDNTHISVQFPAIILVSILSIYKYGRINIKAWGIIVVVVVSTLITFSATSMIGISIFICGIIILLPRKNKKYYKFIKLPSPLITFILFGVISAFLIGGSTFWGIKDTILNIFGKDSTLASRTIIWKNSLFNISEQLIWGYGYESSETVSSKLVNISGQTGWGVSPHNFYLSVLYNGGIILFITIVLAFIILNYKYSSRSNTVEKMIVGLWIFSFMCMCIVESRYGNDIRILLLFSYHILNNEWKKDNISFKYIMR